MSMKKTVTTDSAPAAIGPYSQGVIHGGLLYVSGQIPLAPETMELVSPELDEQINQVFDNLAGVAAAAGAGLNDAIKLTVYLQDLNDFPRVNAIMAERLQAPWPARVAVGVAALPKAALVEIDAIVALNNDG